MKRMTIGLVILLLLGLVAAAAGCADGDGAGKLPTWSIGDR